MDEGTVSRGNEELSVLELFFLGEINFHYDGSPLLKPSDPESNPLKLFLNEFEYVNGAMTLCLMRLDEAWYHGDHKNIKRIALNLIKQAQYNQQLIEDISVPITHSQIQSDIILLQDYLVEYARETFALVIFMETNEKNSFNKKHLQIAIDQIIKLHNQIIDKLNI